MISFNQYRCIQISLFDSRTLQVNKISCTTFTLFRRGYSDDDVVKVLGGNLLRAFKQAEIVAAQLQAAENPIEDIIQYDFSNDTCRLPF